jgi:hypothetical protein
MEPSDCSRLYAAWADSRWANPEDRDLAARVEALAPGTAAAVRHAREFHRQATVRALRHGTSTVVHAPAGLPADPEPHVTTRGRVLHGTHVFADPNPQAVLIRQAVRPTSPRVHAIEGWASRPAELLANPLIAGSPGPWCCHLRLCMHFWPADRCAEVIAGYAALMPPGSWLVTSAGVPGAPPAVTEAFAAMGIPLHWHAPGDVAGWAEDAGMRVVSSGVAYRPSRQGGVGTMIARLP